jgi:hypothetical protein
MRDLRFSQRWLWTLLTPGIQRQIVRSNSVDILGETCRFHLQDRRISQARNQRESRLQGEPPLALLAFCFHVGFLLALFFDPEDEGDMFLRNVGWFQRTTRCYISGDATFQMLAWWTGKDMEENGRGLFAVLFLYFPGGSKENHENFGHDNWCLGRD